MVEAKPTHVIEVTTGEGDPPLLPLVFGQEQAPFSVGRNGVWRILSPGLKDVHAFLYYDGASLFAQSAEGCACSVDGTTIGASWVEVKVPAVIVLGDVRLQYREADLESDEPTSHGLSLSRAEDDATATLAKAPVKPPPDAEPAASFEGSSPPGKRGPSGGPRGASQRPKPPAVPPPGRGRPEPRSVRPPAFPSVAPAKISVPPSQRLDSLEPHAPREVEGALARAPQSHAHPDSAIRAGLSDPFALLEEESDCTRVSPLEATGKQRTGTGGRAPIPAAGGEPQVPTAMPSGPLDPAGNLVSSPLMAAFPPDAHGSTSELRAHSGTHAVGSRFPKLAEATSKATAAWAALPVPRKIMMVAAVALSLGAAFALLHDESPAAHAPRAGGRTEPKAQALAASSTTASEAAPTTPPVAAATTAAFIADWPANVPCPPPNWPADRPPPCTPNGVVASAEPPAATTAATASTERTEAPPRDIPKAAPLPAGKKTLERQAVDLYAAGDYLHAADKYDELAAQNPSNLTYAEAARIARTRAGGRAP